MAPFDAVCTKYCVQISQAIGIVQTELYIITVTILISRTDKKVKLICVAAVEPFCVSRISTHMSDILHYFSQLILINYD